MKRIIVSLSVLSLLTFSSCKKDKDDENVTPTVANLSGTYKITAVTLEGENIFNNSDANKNYYEVCERDNEYKLNTDMTVEVIDAGTVCNPDVSGVGDWSLSGNEITVGNETSTITSFNGKKLVLSLTTSFNQKIVTTYNKQ
jgi:hypothetical protein